MKTKEQVKDKIIKFPNERKKVLCKIRTETGEESYSEAKRHSEGDFTQDIP